MPESRLIVHSELPVRLTPSGLPTWHIVSRDIGCGSHFVAMQTLVPGETVFRHHHPVDETLLFIDGRGTAWLGDETYDIEQGKSLFVAAGDVHGFSNTSGSPLTVVVVFPVPYFAETVFVETSGHHPPALQQR